MISQNLEISEKFLPQKYGTIALLGQTLFRRVFHAECYHFQYKRPRSESGVDTVRDNALRGRGVCPREARVADPRIKYLKRRLAVLWRRCSVRKRSVSRAARQRGETSRWPRVVQDYIQQLDTFNLQMFLQTGIYSLIYTDKGVILVQVMIVHVVSGLKIFLARTLYIVVIFNNAYKYNQPFHPYITSLIKKWARNLPYLTYWSNYACIFRSDSVCIRYDTSQGLSVELLNIFICILIDCTSSGKRKSNLNV